MTVESVELAAGEETEERPGGPPSWGLPAVAVAVVLMVMALLVWVIRPALFPSGLAPAPEVVDEPATSAAAPLPPSFSMVVPPSDSERALASAKEALAAWGRFAGNGRLEELAGRFDPTGPQYEQLMREAMGLRTRPGQPYDVTLTRNALRADHERAILHADVRWARETEAARSFRWRVELRRRGDRWLLWNTRAL